MKTDPIAFDVTPDQYEQLVTLANRVIEACRERLFDTAANDGRKLADAVLDVLGHR